MWLSGKGAAVFVDEFSAAVDSSITNIFGSKYFKTRSARRLLRGASNRTSGHHHISICNL